MNMASVIVPKSDQINADDLLGQTMTITITRVMIRGGQEQPVSIYFEGSDKAFRPCKTMCRVLVQGWGLDANKYVGKSLTLFCDPTVKFGPLAVGGIRISHMSHIDASFTMALAVTKGVKKPYPVKKLDVQAATNEAADLTIDEVRTAIEKASSLKELERIWLSRSTRPFREQLQGDLDDRKAALSFQSEGPDDSQRGESNTNSDADDMIDLIKDAPDLEALEGLEAGYENGGRAAYETPDQDRIETAIAEAKARLKGGAK